jgi:phosphate starvation-inducible PhoH-like protein
MMEAGGNRKGRVRRSRNDQMDVRAEKVNEGNRQIADETKAAGEKYNTGWFKPTEKQSSLIDSLHNNPLTLCDSSSGTGKSTTVIYHALKELASGHYRQIIFIKTPNESSDDAIGFLPNSADDKISVHMEATRSVFRDFMSKAKLELEEKKERIVLTIPNFIQGRTLTNCFVIIDEAQSISPNILKLLLERCGEGSTYAVLGDKFQCYSFKKRENGLRYLIDRVTEVNEEGVRVSKEPLIGYVEMTAKDNMRSELSRRVVEIFEGE